MTAVLTRGGRRGLVWVMLAGALWGTGGPASQLVAQYGATNPLSLSFLRLLTAAPVLLLVGYAVLGPRLWSVTRHDALLMALMGGLIAADHALYFAAIAYAGVAVSTLLVICVAPVLVTLVTALYERRRPGTPTLMATALGLVGASLLVAGSETASPQPESLTGVALALACAGGYAGVILFGRSMAGRAHPLQTTGIAFSAGAALQGVAASLTGFVGTYPLQSWALIAYIGVVPTALAYGVFLLGMRTTPAPVASVLVLLEPLTATLLAWLLFGERLNALGLLGAFLLVGAIALLARADEAL